MKKFLITYVGTHVLKENLWTQILKYMYMDLGNMFLGSLLNID